MDCSVRESRSRRLKQQWNPVPVCLQNTAKCPADWTEFRLQGVCCLPIGQKSIVRFKTVHTHTYTHTDINLKWINSEYITGHLRRGQIKLIDKLVIYVTLRYCWLRQILVSEQTSLLTWKSAAGLPMKRRERERASSDLLDTFFIQCNSYPR